LKEYDLAARIRFCSWFLQSVHDGEFEPYFVFLVWVLIFVMWRDEFSEQPVQECKIFRTYSRTPTSWRKKIGVCCATSARRGMSTICRQELQRVNNVLRWILAAFGREGNIFSIFCSTGGFLLDFMVGYYHSEFFLFFFTDCWTSRDCRLRMT
jgi:hypothetical protein